MGTPFKGDSPYSGLEQWLEPIFVNATLVDHENALAYTDMKYIVELVPIQKCLIISHDMFVLLA